MSWVSSKLDDVCDMIARGISPVYTENKDMLTINQKCVRNHRVDLSLTRMHDSKSKIVKQERLVKYGDVLVNSTGTGTLGRVAQYLEEPSFDITVDTHVTIVRPKDGMFYIPFFGFMMIAIENQLKEAGEGASGQTELSRIKIANDFIVSYPKSKQTQQEIVKKLDAILAEIDKVTTATEANIKNAEALFQSYLTEVFRADKHIDELCNIGSFLKLEYGKGLDESDRKESGAYFAYGANGIKAKTNKFLFDKPSIIVGRKGSVGELSLVFDRFWPLDVTYYVTHDSDRTDLKYLYYGLMAQNLPKYAKGVKPGINRNDVYALQMRLPSLIEQKKIALKFADLSEKVNDLSAIYKNKIKSLSSIKKNILLQAFNGKLVKEQE